MASTTATTLSWSSSCWLQTSGKTINQTTQFSLQKPVFEIVAQKKARKIILKEDVEPLGMKGQLVDVNAGYCRNPASPRSLTITFAATESSSPDSSKALDAPNPQPLLQELADSLVLPPDYFAKLPRDLRLDLNDAAFDLSSGPIIAECGQELGETLLNLSKAWELADTSTSGTLAGKLPSLVDSATNNVKSALGKRLLASGRRFQSMGQYGQGELQRIAKAMLNTGKLLSASPVTTQTEEATKDESRMFKFGELQVELTSQKAYIGAIIALVFGVISWEASQGIQNMPEGSMQYANENALMLAQSLRGALLAIFYASTFLSAMTSVGLILLARQLKSDKD